MRKLLIIASLILFIITSCRELINPVDPESDLYIGKPSVDVDGDGIGQYEDVDEITLISPQNGATVTEFPLVLETYKFNPEKVRKYWIQISTSNSDFENELVFSKDDYTSNECEVPPIGLEVGVPYYWRAKAFDGSKWSDNWSGVWSFTVDVDMSVPWYPSPSNGSTIIDTTPPLDWEDVLGAIGYHVQVNTNNSFTGTSIADDTTLIQSDYQVGTPLSNNTIYYWRVKIKNTDGVWGDWSSIWEFSVELEIPSSPSPSSGSTICNTTPLLDWEDISSTDGYHIQVSEVIDFSSAIIESHDTLAASESEYQIVTPLANNTTYYWRVKIKDTNSIWGDWSSVWSFNVDIGFPVLLSPSNGSVTTDTTPTFDWQDFSGASGYQIQIDNDSDFSSPVVNDNTLSISTFTPASNLSEATYYWHVKVKESNEIWGDWCNTWNFTVDASPPTASFTVSPDWGWMNVTIFNVDASSSSDNLTPSSGLQVRWDWENDGAWDTSYSTMKTSSHTYTTDGIKTIKVEVKDNAGLTSTTTTQITLYMNI